MNYPNGDRLSWGDSVFLNLEREGMPLNVGCICVLEGEVPFETYVRFVESRLPRIPRYQMRLAPSPLNLSLPCLEYDPDFSIRNHIREVTLKHGSDAELQLLAATLFGEVLDRKYPLWDLTLVRGLKGNRTGLIARLHHCLADGIAGVGVMSALMDATPEMPRLPKRKARAGVPPNREAAPNFVNGLADSYSDFSERILSAWGGLLNFATQSLARRESLAQLMREDASHDDFSELMPEISAPTERLRFNALYTGPQKFAFTEIPLADVKAIKSSCGATVNDVLLALITATVRRYSELHGDDVKGRLFRVMVPVNLRSSDTSTEMGNSISLIAVTVPLDIRDPKKLLAAVHRRTEFLKHARAAELVGLAGGLLGVLPFPMQSVVGPLISRLPVTPFNMVCTNVPGPQFPLYVLGHKMTQWYPYVPVGGEMSLNCALLSYNGAVYFGFSGDAHIASDLPRLEKLLQSSFTELRESARIRSPKRRSARKSAGAVRRSSTRKRASSLREQAAEPVVPQLPMQLAVPRAGAPESAVQAMRARTRPDARATAAPHPFSEEQLVAPTVAG